MSCATPHVLFLRNDRKTLLSSVNLLQIIMWENSVVFFLQSVLSLWVWGVFFQYFSLKQVLWGSNKHAFVCLFYNWTLVCWRHDEADYILCFVAFGKDSGCHRLAAKQFVGTAALQYDIMCFRITSKLGQRKKNGGLTTVFLWERGFACLSGCGGALACTPSTSGTVAFSLQLVQKHLERRSHFQYEA